MNTSKQCRIDNSSGQLFSILFKENDSLAKDTIDNLARQFDLVIVSPGICSDSDTQPEECNGVEVTVLRKKASVDLDSSDISAVLNAGWPEGSGKKGIITNITDGLQFYEAKCDRKSD